MSTETQTKKNYKDTLNLPQTSFSMEAKLVQNEPLRLKKWQDERLYEQVLAARAKSDKGKWILHDGPPFANGDIHIGHLINKTLKDIIIRFRTMEGFQTPYVPGWDCHGLPIEHKIQEQFKGKLREMSTVEVRQHCHAYADKYVKIQSEQFQRLGILGEWNDPYLTMAPGYEASTLEVFAKFVEAGLVYKQLKPVHWSIVNQTALADAELEYQDVTDTSVYVEFPVFKDPAHENLHLIIWTTTPWTLPANMAVAVHPQGDYSFVSYIRAGNPRVGIVASALVDRVFKDRPGVASYVVIDQKKGEELIGMEYDHPFVKRIGKVVAADYVTTTEPEGEEPGTGLVHTAPGHGEEDYLTGINNGLEVYSPVLPNGLFDDTVPEWLRGKQVFKANPEIVKHLHDLGVLFAEKPITHSYPHDWRSKTPTIFRATEQWFVAMDRPFVTSVSGAVSMSLRERALACTRGPKETSDDKFESLRFAMEAAKKTMSPDVLREVTSKEVRFSRAASLYRGHNPNWEETEDALLRALMVLDIRFVPEWGRHRLKGMLESRPDWCISRQRAWGLPIPVFYNEQNEPLLTPASVRAVAKRFAEKGSDAWFTDSPAELLGSDFRYPPGFRPDQMRKEKDIFDVWFESGSSWHAVLQARPYLQFPADMYLEGSDQHRGWFQLSLLPSLGATGRPPFKSVLTHGFVVKPDGTKVSKSDKEYVKAVDEINRHGADLLRLWCSSVDYQGDIPASPKALQEFGDKYRKIRNTVRYLLSNLYDFDPSKDAQEIVPNSLDGWANAELDTLIREVRGAYDAYQLHRVFRLLHDFCAVQISAVYGNAMKDRLYCEAPASPLRRRAQTVMHRMAAALIKMLAPIVVFTADEAWEHLKRTGEEAKLSSVHLALLPEPSSDLPNDDQREEWKLLMDLRSDALSQLDKLTRSIGKYKALDAELIFHIDDDAMRRKLQAYGADLEDMVGAGFHSFTEKGPEGPAVTVELIDRRDKYAACARSWKRRPDVGQDAQYPDLSLRDANAVRSPSPLYPGERAG